MADDEGTLSDRWMRGIKNNPLVALLIVAGALIAIASPILEILKPWWGSSGNSAAHDAPADHRRLDKLEEDRDTILVPVRNALRENKALYAKLSSPLYNEPGWGVQESYYERVRRDGPEKHELMRGMIDTMVQTNEKILGKLDSYIGRAVTPALKSQEALFREHARLYQARWSGMKNAAITGEEQPIAEPVFPAEFPASLDGEIEAVEQLIRKRAA